VTSSLQGPKRQPYQPPGVVVDTGPLLCLGWATELRGHLRRCSTHGEWVSAVQAELARHISRPGPRGELAVAARRHNAAWLGTPRGFQPEDPDVAAVLATMHQLAGQKSASGRQEKSAGPREHLGEAESIVHARQQGLTVLTHDRDAGKVARSYSVPELTIVDVARGFVADGSAAPQHLFDELRRLMRAGIDVGEHLNGVLDLAPGSRRRR
jgi:hypothetical protein